MRAPATKIAGSQISARAIDDVRNWRQAWAALQQTRLRRGTEAWGREKRLSEVRRKRYGLEEYRDVIIAPPYKVEYTKFGEEVWIRVVGNAGKARAGGRGSWPCMYK